MSKLCLIAVVLFLSSCASHVEKTKTYDVVWKGSSVSKDVNGICHSKLVDVNFKTIATNLGELQSPEIEVTEEVISCDKISNFNESLIVPVIYVTKISTIEEPGKCSKIFNDGDLVSSGSIIRKYGQEVVLNQVISCKNKGE